jgi:UDP-2,4-diacetamido-2,4,6-trideoxy-beta-L-altropyranose hydrolase
VILMASQRIAFRTDASGEIGTGHFMRCLTLADALKKHGVEICFVARKLPAHLIQMLDERKIDFYGLPLVNAEEPDELPHSQWLQTSQNQDAIQTIEVLGSCKLDWLVVDHYAIDQRWERSLRDKANKIMVIDDLADRQHDCDVLLDQNFYQNMDTRYVGKVPSHCQLLLGPSYALLREEFRNQRQHVKPRTGDIKNMLVFFGGVDAQNYTSLALEAIVASNLQFDVDVVVGQQHPSLQDVQMFCKTHHYACHVQTHQMGALMAKADLAIGAGGTAMWERCCMGLPSICISTADNQEQQVNDLMDKGLIVALQKNQDVSGLIKRALVMLNDDISRLGAMSKTVYHLVDGNGIDKVESFLFPKDIEIRLANEADSKNIYSWRNHPLIRKHSGSASEIEWAEHEKWFANRCGQPHHPILIGHIKNQPIGVVRFDIRENFADVSIYRVPNSGHQGIGKNLLCEAEAWLKINHPYVVAVHAWVLQENDRSKKLFEKSQYVKHADSAQIEYVKQL